jgi:protein-disulfide isomerase
MMNAHFPRWLFWSTTGAFLLGLMAIFYPWRAELPPGIFLSTHGQPTIGYPQAPVHLVVFEEPKCSNCRDFSLSIFPKIKKEFIDTNKILYTTIPVSFLPGSMRAAVSLLCVYHVENYPNDDLFFTYLNYIYEHLPDEKLDWATEERLLKFAKAASPAIHSDTLRNCIARNIYRVQIETNTRYGNKIMAGHISTPAVFVNGIEVKELTYESINKLIKEIRSEQGLD